MLLQACLNGSRRPGEHPRLPLTAGDLARAASAAVGAGARAVHLHVKDDDGADALDGAALARVLGAVRGAVPGVEIGVTTGAWAAPDPGARLAALRGWTAVPDCASVNWHEPGAEDVAAELLGRGVGVEAGLWHLDAAAAWSASALRDRCRRVLLELPDDLHGAAVTDLAADLLGAVRAATAERVPVLLHGEGISAWPALRLAASWGLDTRIGLEDVLVMPDGAPAPDGTALVEAAVRVVSTTEAAHPGWGARPRS